MLQCSSTEALLQLCSSNEEHSSKPTSESSYRSNHPFRRNGHEFYLRSCKQHRNTRTDYPASEINIFKVQSDKDTERPNPRSGSHVHKQRRSITSVRGVPIFRPSRGMQSQSCFRKAVAVIETERICGEVVTQWRRAIEKRREPMRKGWLLHRLNWILVSFTAQGYGPTRARLGIATRVPTQSRNHHLSRNSEGSAGLVLADCSAPRGSCTLTFRFTLARSARYPLPATHAPSRHSL